MSDYELVLKFLKGESHLKKAKFPIEYNSFLDPNSKSVSTIVLSTRDNTRAGEHFLNLSNAFTDLWSNSSYLTIYIGPHKHLEVVLSGDRTLIESLNGPRNTLSLNGYEPQPLVYKLNQKTYSGARIKVGVKSKQH